ncbi:MAG: flagellar hook-basal body complex protein [Bacteroides sp.]|nr:flagellar hook-basal body complex protein [Eubacterium sp.]MCM1419464.1 flagellar hook-basal body complex protein [Roseburia sp.]MCM1463324.1 flagellar hook-basal body complex protein [Bacteroides sp.]
MMKSLYSGVAGMKTHNQRMDVVGNNISNVNTVGYKAGTVTFKDVYYQTKAGATSGDATSGGKNPTQIGYGVRLGTVNQVMGQSGFNYTDNVFDVAIEGEGFFQVMDDAGNVFYSRNGAFSVDSYGNLVDPNGYIVLGVSGDPSNVQTGQSQRINLSIPPVDNNIASASKTVNGYGVTVSASTYGEEGNLSFTIVDSDTPFATRSGSNIVIYMDLSQDFGHQAMEDLYTNYADTIAAVEAYELGAGDPPDNETLQNLQLATEAAFNVALEEFQNAVNNAIEQGGIGLEEGVLPLNFEMDSVPSYDEIMATQASNIVELTQAILDDDGNETGEFLAYDLRFEADTPGAFGNKFEVDLKTQSGQGTVTAKWRGDVLTITIPETGATLEEIQAQITLAAGGDSNKSITVSARAATVTYEEVADVDGIERGVTTRTAEGEFATEGDFGDFDFGAALNGSTARTTLDGGQDNFFSDLAIALSTVTMTDGRVAAEQQIDDCTNVSIDSDGVIYARHAVHGLLLLGRIDLATFVNPMGLNQVGTSLWQESLASGEAQVKIPTEDGAGSVVSNALEMSNVDLAQEFSDMIITQRGYQANSRVITVSDSMLEELVNLKR